MSDLLEQVKEIQKTKDSSFKKPSLSDDKVKEVVDGPTPANEEKVVNRVLCWERSRKFKTKLLCLSNEQDFDASGPTLRMLLLETALMVKVETIALFVSWFG